VAIKMLPDVPKLMLPAVLNRSANANLTTANAQNHIGPAIDAKTLPKDSVTLDGVPFS